MPYTYKSLAFVWFVILGLFALAGSGIVVGAWVLLLVALALAVPVLLLRGQAAPSTPSFERPQGVADEGHRSGSSLDGMDVYRWENEGGARRMPARYGNREPGHAAP
jgi:hypothetical protein